MFLDQHYWKTWGKHELDLVEEWSGKIHGYEFQWKAGKSKQEKQWRLANPDASFTIINRENYFPFCVQLGYDIAPSEDYAISIEKPTLPSVAAFPQIPSDQQKESQLLHQTPSSWDASMPSDLRF